MQKVKDFLMAVGMIFAIPVAGGLVEFILSALGV